MKQDNAKLFVHDAGDPSVGINAVTWQVDVPFEKDHPDVDEFKEIFRQDAKNLYSDYANGRLTAYYDFEIEAVDSAR